MDTNLGNIIKNDKARAAIYGTYVILGIIIGTLQAVFVDPDPQWLETAFRGWSYLAIPVGGLAALNSNIVPTRYVTTGHIENVSAQQVTVNEAEAPL